ncbi:hypothetical protein [Proteus sp. TSJ240517]|uniref:hypothetical protein n=1 Tax=Proteus sp. TSJ240517 TaxID=3399622 RepID=UPI003A4DB59F
MKGTTLTELSWAYTDEATRRKRKYIKQTKDYNRHFFKPYRCMRVAKKLFRLELNKLMGGI